MAKTGKTSGPFTPTGGRYCRVVAAPEHSVQSLTAGKGMPGIISAGYISYETGHITKIYGFSRVAPQDGASDGAKTASLYRAQADVPFSGAYLGTLSETVRGLRVNISVDASGAQWLKYNSDSSSVGAAYITGWTSDWDAGDVNPTVSFALRPANIQTDI